jgi:hypothetical protein
MSWVGAGLGMFYAIYNSGASKLVGTAGFLFPKQYFEYTRCSEVTKLGIETFLCVYIGSIAGSATHSAFISLLPCALASVFAIALDSATRFCTK